MVPRSLTLRDARGTGAVLRITDHPDEGKVVFSHWRGEVCVASTPIELMDLLALVEFLSAAAKRPAADPSSLAHETPERRLLTAFRQEGAATPISEGEIRRPGVPVTRRALVDSRDRPSQTDSATDHLQLGGTGGDVA